MIVSVAEGPIVVPKTHTYKSLDAWRGLASLWVVLYHTSAPLSDKFNLSAQRAYDLPLNGYLGVSVFFVVSGYCIAHAAAQALGRTDGLKCYAAARFRRIYWPCLFSLPFYLSLGMLAAFLVSHHILKSSALAQQGFSHQNVLYYLSNLTLTQIVFQQKFVSNVCWTLCYEVAFYVIVGLVITLKAVSEKQLLTTLHALTIATLAYWIVMPKVVIYPLDYWPLFGLGVLVYDLLKHRSLTAKLAFFIIGSLFIVFALLNISGGYLGRGTRATFLTAFVTALLLWCLHSYDARLMRIKVVQALSWLGLFSYSLYLTHWLVVGLVLQTLVKLHHETPWLCLILCPLVSVAVAFGFYQLFERPFMKKKPLPLSKTATLERA